MDVLGRPTSGASVAPDATAFAHLIDDGGYPRAVQRFLDGMRVSSSRRVRLPVEGPITTVVHSPDGRWLACQTAPSAGTRSQVWVVTTDLTDSEAWRLDNTADDSASLVGWDGDQVAITAEHDDGLGEARLVDPRTGVTTVLDRRPLGALVDSWAGSCLVRVGPRGNRSLRLLRGGQEIALFREDPGSTTDRGVLLDDHRPRRLLPGVPGAPSRRYVPSGRASPDGSDGYLRLLVRTDTGGDRLRLVQVTVTSDGLAYRDLAGRDDADLDEFAVSADTSTVALLWNVGGGVSQLQILELTDGSLRAPIPLPAPVASQLSISADGSLLAVTVEGPGHPRCVELVAPRTGEWVAIERVRKRSTAPPELVRLAARDGAPLSGWLYRAPPRDRWRPRDNGAPDAAAGSPNPGPQAPAPLVVDLHGGPEDQARPRFSDLYPALLEAGITVFAPNVRGSGGFGRWFSSADDVERRFAAFDDVADVVDHLVAEEVADRGRIACCGWSYGGFLTLAALAAHPELFVTGVSICGMSDLRTFYATTEPWIALAAHGKYGHPERDAELLGQLSPLARVHDIRAPVLAVHGATDTNVPPQESTQIVDALRACGVPARAVVVEGEGHVFTQPENRARLASLVTRWVSAAFAGEDVEGVAVPWRFSSGVEAVIA